MHLEKLFNWSELLYYSIYRNLVNIKQHSRQGNDMTITEINERLYYGLMSVTEAQLFIDVINMGSDTSYYIIENNQATKA